MYKKFVSTILVVSLLNFLGCSTYMSLSKSEFKQLSENEVGADEIIVETEDLREYHFFDNHFIVMNDTVYGKGVIRAEEKSYEGMIAVKEIESIEFKERGFILSSSKSFSQYQKYKAEEGKPDEIIVRTKDDNRYFFMKNDYQVEKDNLYGKGKMLFDDDIPRDLELSLSEIEYIEMRNNDVVGTTILVFTITALIGVGVVLISFSLNPPNFVRM